MNLTSKGEWAVSDFHEDQTKAICFTPLGNSIKNLNIRHFANHVKNTSPSEVATLILILPMCKFM